MWLMVDINRFWDGFLWEYDYNLPICLYLLNENVIGIFSSNIFAITLVKSQGSLEATRMQREKPTRNIRVSLS